MSDYFKKQIENTGKELSVALNSDNFSDGGWDALQEILSNLGNESQIHTSHPELITHAYRLMIEAVDQGYGRGVHNCIQSIIEGESRENEKFADELKSLDSKQETILDLSEQPENLNILAADLSKILKNPLLPADIYDAIQDRLTTVGADTDGVDWILANLKGGGESA